ncbi:LysR family transcriptional regulator [uncultured Cohaesibacter sp.]|uniref:LysR family transcriptional regulator n=1 Tax=uncultured Cohaesibacter sp. TaxID=1002546 RepID=UPI0029C6CD04|nr:LysR family transcriptional regulator [uncultured Cohaesibacter sp.]
MSIKGVQLIQAILSEGSLTAAANSLNISQPTASKLLGDFENSISAPLFNRVRGRLVPTREARFLGGEISELIEAVEAFEAKARALSRGDRRDIELYVCGEILEGGFAPALSRLWAEHPEMIVSVKPAPETRSAIIDCLSASPTALVLTLLKPPFAKHMYREIGRMRYRLVVPKGQEAAPWSLRQVLAPKGSLRHHITADYYAALGLDLRTSFTAPTLGSQMSFVETGFGAAFMPNIQLPSGLVALTPSQLPTEPIWLVGQSKKLPLVLRRLIAHLQSES